MKVGDLFDQMRRSERMSDEPTPVEATSVLRSFGGLQLPTIDDLQALLPDAHIERVGDREELVIYTGWSTADDAVTLVPMSQESA